MLGSETVCCNSRGSAGLEGILKQPKLKTSSSDGESAHTKSSASSKQDVDTGVGWILHSSRQPMSACTCMLPAEVMRASPQLSDGLQLHGAILGKCLNLLEPGPKCSQVTGRAQHAATAVTRLGHLGCAAMRWP